MSITTATAKGALGSVALGLWIFNYLRWHDDHRGATETQSAPLPQPDSNTARTQAIDNALQLIAYASRSGKQLKADDVATVITAHRAGSAITAAEEKSFWLSSAAIAKDLAPVTVESLTASSPIAVKGKSPAAIAAIKYRHRTVITLALLLIFQIYWLIGAAVTSDLKDIRLRLEKLSSEGASGKAAIAALNPQTPDHDAAKRKLEAEGEEWNNRLYVERISASTNFQVLRNWNISKTFLLRTWTPTAPSDSSATPETEVPRIKSTDFFLWEFTPDNVAELQTAQIMLTALLKYILPILYGALGASAYIVRTLANEIRDSTHSVGSTLRYQLRFYLGAVAGLSIAWFTSDPKPAETAGLLQSLSPLALAFLAGYGVELLFSLLDRLVGAFSTLEAKHP